MNFKNQFLLVPSGIYGGLQLLDTQKGMLKMIWTALRHVLSTDDDDASIAIAVADDDGLNKTRESWQWIRILLLTDDTGTEENR